MAISTVFQEKIDLVDTTWDIVYHTDEVGYDTLEWSYTWSGGTYHVYGGSDLGCEYGASELLEDLGFRFYATASWSHKLPQAPLTTGLSKAKQSFWIKNSRVQIVYGQSFESAIFGTDRTTLEGTWLAWLKLNAQYDTVYPIGHRWSSIIAAQPAFFAANPGMVLTLSTGAKSFALATMTPAERTSLVELCAAYLLNLPATEGFNSYGRAYFDPTDSDSNTSDDVFLFAKDVAIKARAGTSAIGTIGAKAGVANATVGVYAYAGHRLPPSFSVAPYVYVGVTLGFNRSTLSYEELIAGHQATADSVMIREYYNTHIWSEGHPWGSAGSVNGYYERYDDYVASGLDAVNGEFCLYWLSDMVHMRTMVRKFKTGSYTHSQAIAEIVADLFDNDPKVTELFEYWMRTGVSYNRWSLKKSFDIVAAMNDAGGGARPYKDKFKKYLTILYKWMYLPPQLAPANPNWNTASDPFPAAFASVMSNITAVRMDEIIHSYAWIRQEANSAVNNYPALKYGASPSWYTASTAPTDQEFEDAHDYLIANATRDDTWDEEDLVMMRGLTPGFNAGTNALGNPSTFYFTHGEAFFAFVGPGTVTHSQRTSNAQPIDGGEVITNTYGTGLHFIRTPNNYWYTTWSGGYLFLHTFPRVRRDNGATSFQYLYVPQRCSGAVQIEAESRVRLYTAGAFGSATVLNIIPSTSVGYVNPASAVPTGQVTIEGGNTSGFWNVINANPWISPNKSYALVPRVIAEEDFPNAVKVRKV